MSRTCESKRRKDICNDCQRFIAIKAKGKCQNCWHKFKSHYDIHFFLRQRYSQIKQRCTNTKREDHKRYLGKLNIDIDTFYNKFINNKTFLKLFKEWQDSNFDYKKAPSVDRIDNTKDYSIDNIQFITHSNNCLKDQIKLKITLYLTNGEKIGDFESLNEAVRYADVQQSNAWKVLNGLRKQTGGYVFKYTKS